MFQGVECFSDFTDIGSGFEWYKCFEIFSCIMINSVMIIDKMVMNHVDVSS